MKAATILLLAVTVLTGLPQQSSAVPQLGSQIENLGGKNGSGVTGKADESVVKGVGAVGGTGKRNNSGNAGKPSGGTDRNNSGNAGKPSGGTDRNNSGNAGKPSGGTDRNNSGNAGKPSGGTDRNNSCNAGKPSGGTDRNNSGNAGKPSGGTDRNNSGNAGKPSGGTDVSLIFDQAAKYIETVKVTLADLTRKLEPVKGTAKVKVEEATAKVAAHLEQVESIVAMILKGAEVTAETAEKPKVLLLQVEEKIKADLAELRTVIIEAILQKGGQEVSSVVLTTKSNVAKVTQDVDIILSQLSKALEAVLTKTNGAIVNTDHEFKSLFAKLIESWKAYIGRIVKVLQGALAKVTGAEKKGLFKVEKLLEGLKGLAYAKFAEGDFNETEEGDDNKNLLEDLKARTTKVIAATQATQAAVPKLLATLGGTPVGAILKEETARIMKNANPFPQLIAKLLPY